jgi:hypothetical protein
VLLAAETWFLLVAHERSGPLTPHSELENFALGVTAALVGAMLFRSKDRIWSWFALLISSLGMWNFWVWPILIGRRMPMNLYSGGPPWLVLMNFEREIVLPAMLIFSLISLFQHEPKAASGTASAPKRQKRHAPLFGTLSIIFPALGLPYAYMIMRAGQPDEGRWAPLITFVFFCYLALVLGLISVIAAYLRWEKYGFLPLIGCLVNAAPLLWLGQRLIMHDAGGIILGISFCAICTVLSLATKDKGRAWALLAAIPSAFMLISMVGPAVTEFVRKAL